MRTLGAARPMGAAATLVIAAAVGLGLALGMMAQTSARIGVIEGTVVDGSGKPVGGAEVGAVPAGILAYAITFITADQNGNFKIDGLELREYFVHARKEAEGYPDTSFSDYGGIPTRITLSPQSPAGRVVVRFGPKAVFITPSFSDEETGDAVHPDIRVWLWGDPARSFSTTGHLNPDLLVPSGKAIGFEFRAGGYDVWRYPDGPEPGKPLTMGPGARLALKVEFRRSAVMRALDSRLLQPALSEAEILEIVSEMFEAAPADARTGREIAEAVTQRQSTELARSVLAKFVPEALISACLDSPVSGIRQAALQSLDRQGNMLPHLAPKLRALAANPQEEAESRRLAQELADRVK